MELPQVNLVDLNKLQSVIALADSKSVQIPPNYFEVIKKLPITSMQDLRYGVYSDQWDIDREYTLYE